MIDTVSLTKDWLVEKQKSSGKDPSIIESMIYALYLLEQLKLIGLDFIFKGGTSLLLIIPEPARFSVDIDIIVSPSLKKEELEVILNKITIPGAFLEIVLDERRSYKTDIPKAHYKFIYKSNNVGKDEAGQKQPNPEREILLDVLFAENPYPIVIERPINTEWIKLKTEPQTVKTPCANSITGDKLTAFAPNTTGVPYYRESKNKNGDIVQTEMYKEIIKQLFDVGCLFNIIDDINLFHKSYESNANAEIKYRQERGIKSIDEILNDTIETAMILAVRDKQKTEDALAKYGKLKEGINAFTNFVYKGTFNYDYAQVAGAKAAYLAATVLKKNTEALIKFDEKIPMAEYLIQHPEYTYLNKPLKFAAKGEALFYWNQAIKILYPMPN